MDPFSSKIAVCCAWGVCLASDAPLSVPSIIVLTKDTMVLNGKLRGLILGIIGLFVLE